LKRLLLFTLLAAATLVPAAAFGATDAARPGTRSNPWRAGTAVKLSDGWTVRVLSATPNANRAVMAENQFNDPPAAGRQFFMVRIRATYRGAKESDTYDGGFRLRAVGRANVGYTSFEDSCGVIPGEDALDADVFRGGSVVGTVCWSVRRSDAASLVMYDDGGFLSSNRVFFRVR
jgi:hypothetical protein